MKSIRIRHPQTGQETTVSEKRLPHALANGWQEITTETAPTPATPPPTPAPIPAPKSATTRKEN